MKSKIPTHNYQESTLDLSFLDIIELLVQVLEEATSSILTAESATKAAKTTSAKWQMIDLYYIEGTKPKSLAKDSWRWSPPLQWV